MRPTLLVLVLAAITRAEDAGTAVDGYLQRGESADDIEELLEEAAQPRDGLFRRGPVSLFGPAWRRLNKRLEESVGLTLGVAFTTLYQYATDGEAASGDTDIFGKWKVRRGVLGFALEHRDRFTNIAPSALGGRLGTLWGTTSAFGEHDFALIQLWWEQHLLDDRLIVTVGKVDPDNFYNGNRASSSNTLFLNAAFASNPTRFHPNGLGANVRVKPSDRYYVSVGFGDLNGAKTKSGFDTFGDHEFYYALEFGWTPEGGHYRITYYYFNAREGANPAGGGVSLSLDQQIGANAAVFLRYGFSDEVRTIRHILSFGGGIRGPFGRTDDIVAVGLAWGRDGDEEYVVEVFYRIQLTPAIQITPHVQGIFDGPDAIAVVGVRARLSF